MKKLGVMRYVEIGLFVLIIIMAVNRFFPSKRIEAATNVSRSYNEAGQFELENDYQEIEEAANTNLHPIAQLGLDYYIEKSGDSEEGIESVLQNYGCHMEVHIYKDSELVMRLSYFNGQVYEL